MSEVLHAILVCRYAQDAEHRVILCAHFEKMGKDRKIFIEDTVKKLLGNDNFLKSKVLMITEFHSAFLIYLKYFSVNLQNQLFFMKEMKHLFTLLLLEICLSKILFFIM
jgi:hypothetical protein